MEGNFEHLNKLPCNSGDFFLIKTNWQNGRVNISIYHSTTNKSFKGELSKDEIEETAKELEIPLTAFRNEIISALTAHMGQSAYSYELDIEEKKLVLKKKTAFTIQYLLGIKLRENPSITGEMLEAAIGFINEQKQKNSQIEELKERIQENYKATCEALEKCLDEKRNLEADLIKKFVLLLNSKKDKISELQEMLTCGLNDSANEESDSGQNYLTSGPSTSDIAAKVNRSREKSVNNDDAQIGNCDNVNREAANDDDDFHASTQVLSQLPEDAIVLLTEDTIVKRKNSDADNVKSQAKIKSMNIEENNADVDC